MIFLHTSDWHIGAMEGDRSLLEDQQFFIDGICSVIQENRVDAVLIAGDVYDRPVASAEAIRLYDHAVTRICRDLNTPVLIIAGNHDSAERLASCSDLLAPAGLHVIGEASRTPQKVSFADTDVYMLPWITEEKVRSLFPEEKEGIKSLEDAYRVVTDSMRGTFDPEKKHLILAHAFITDSETSTSDRAAEIGFAVQVPAAVFDGFDYVALGHLHKPQDVNSRIRYSGTPMPYSFGREETQEKSVTLLDTESMSRRIIPLPLLHRRTTLAGTLDELLRPTADEAVRNGYVRLQISDAYVGLETLSALRNVYPNLLEVSGKNYDDDNGAVMLSAEELRRLESDPMEVFRHFCREELDLDADEHQLALFADAVKAGEETA